MLCTIIKLNVHLMFVCAIVMLYQVHVFWWRLSQTRGYFIDKSVWQNEANLTGRCANTALRFVDTTMEEIEDLACNGVGT